MKFSWKWLNEIIDLHNIPVHEISNKLTLAGFEIEEVINKDNIEDKTINIDITSNRADVNSMVGLAREIGSIFNITLPDNKINQQQNSEIYIYSNIYNLEKNNLLSQYMLDIRFHTIQNLITTESPLWLKNYLNGCDIESTYLLNDLIRYINIKWGQDIEIFDLNKITDNINQNLTLEFKRIDSKLYTDDLSDFKESNIIPIIDVIKYNDKIISIMGLESNTKFYCDNNTSSIIIMGKIYNPNILKNITTGNNIKTEISNKHIKGISRNDFISAYEEINKIIMDLHECELGTLFTYNQPQKPNKIIEIKKQDIDKILGPCNKEKNTYINKNEIIKILNQLHFNPKYSENKFSVKIPEYRKQDLIRSVDIIEEIARIYGFDKFSDKLPKYEKTGHISENIKIIQKIRQIFRNAGLHEVIHYSLDNKYKKISEKDSPIKLYNPLLEDQSQLKTSLIPHLIDASIYNYKQKNLYSECFEIGKIFKENIHKKTENLAVAGIIGNPNFSRYLWSKKSQSLNWYQAKGFLEEFFEKINCNIKWCEPKSINHNIINQEWLQFCHPYRLAIIANKNNPNEVVGIFSQINTKLKYAIGINHELYIFELNINNLINSNTKIKHLNYSFNIYSNYPSVTRDISLILNKKQSINSIIDYIFSTNNPLIESVQMIHEYKSINQKKENRTVSFRITYRSNIRTLNDTDIQKINTEIDNLLKTQ